MHHPTTVRQVLSAEYRAARNAFRPPSSQESAGKPAGSPAVKARGGTRKRSKNRLVWLQIALHLEDTRKRA